MAITAAILGVVLIMTILWDAFETVILPRRVTRRIRFTRLFYRRTWLIWKVVVRAITSHKRQETIFGFYGPLSLLLLLTIWACGILIGFALLHWAVDANLSTPEGDADFLTHLYFSGTTFFTLGLGDVRSITPWGKALTVVQAGLGFGFLALIIGYLPALNQSFSRREISVSLLDARAGSPPTAAEMLNRHNNEHGMEALRQLLYEWEQWSAEFLEIHLSYPVLAYFRSQHDNQSWLAALTAILDACSLIMVGLEGSCKRQAQLTFAMARHAVADLALVFDTPPHSPRHDRLSAADLGRLRDLLTASGMKLHEGVEADDMLTELRKMYEPYVYALSSYLHLTLPPWLPAPHPDNWQTSAWSKATAFKVTGSSTEPGERHF
jgi:hypothetical protein